MKLLCKKIKSYMCLEIFQSTNETNQRGYSVLFQSFSKALNCRGREEVNLKWYPKVNYSTEKVFFEKNFLEWPTGR